MRATTASDSQVNREENPTTTVEIAEIKKEHIEYTNKQAAITLAKFATAFLMRSIILMISDFGTKEIISIKNESLLSSYGDANVAQSLMISFLLGAAFQFGAFVSSAQEEAEQKKIEPQKVGEIFRHGMLFSAILGVPAAIAMPFLAPSLLKLSQQPSDIVHTDSDFFYWGSWGLLFEVLYRTTVASMAALSVQKTSLYGEIADTVVQLGVTAGLMFGLNMGLEAAALGYAISKLTTLLFHLALIYRHDVNKQYHLLSTSTHFDKQTLKNIAKSCLPQGVNGCIAGLAGQTVALFCGNEAGGSSALAAMNVASLYSSVVGLPVGAITRAGAKHVAQYSENKTSRNAVTFGNMNTLICTAIPMVGAAFAMIFPELIARTLINPNDPSQKADFDMAVTFIRIQSVLDLLGCPRFSIDSACLGGVNDTLVPMLVTIGCDFLINLAAAAAVRYGMQSEPSFVYGSQGIGFLLAAFILLVRWHQTAKDYGKPELPIADNAARLLPTPRATDDAEGERKHLLSERNNAIIPVAPGSPK